MDRTGFSGKLSKTTAKTQSILHHNPPKVFLAQRIDKGLH